MSRRTFIVRGVGVWGEGMLRCVAAKRSAVWEIDQASTRSREDGVGVVSSFASIDFSGVAIFDGCARVFS